MAKTTAAMATMAGPKILGSGMIDPRELVVDADANGRRYTEGVDDMVKSLLNEGQKSPVRTRLKGGKQVVVFGNRRTLAAQQITEKGLLGEGVVFQLRYEEVDENDADAFIENLIENKDRKDLTIIDHAHNYLRLTAEPFNMSQRDIAKRLLISDALVSRSLSLVRGVKDHPPLSAKHQKLVHLGKVATETAYEMITMAEEAREALVAAILAGKTVTASDAKEGNAKRKPGKSGEETQAGKALTAKAIRLPFEAVVTGWPEDKEPTAYVNVCDIIVQLCTGKIKAPTALKKLKALVGE